MQTATIVSIVSAALIIGLSIGVTMYFDPVKRSSSLQNHQSSLQSTQHMIDRCNNLLTSLTTTNTNDKNANNVINYNIQKLYGTCTKDKDIVDLIPMTGCTSENGFEWIMKEDVSFCPGLNSGTVLNN